MTVHLTGLSNTYLKTSENMELLTTTLPESILFHQHINALKQLAVENSHISNQ